MLLVFFGFVHKVKQRDEGVWGKTSHDHPNEKLTAC
jgi:hypothetical protein